MIEPETNSSPLKTIALFSFQILQKLIVSLANINLIMSGINPTKRLYENQERYHCYVVGIGKNDIV